MASLTPLLRNASSECAFQGEPDIYGFGIRLGIYLQWTSVLIVRTFKLRGRASLAKSYVIFIFAIFVALLFMTANATPSTEINKSSDDADKGPYAVEVMILAYIIFGGVYIVLLTGNDPMPIQRFDVDTVTRLCRQFVFWCVLTAASVYYIWFWLDGIQGSGFLKAPEGCGTYGFLFAKVSLSNQSVKTFFAFCSILVTIGWVWGFAVYCLAVAPCNYPVRNESRLARAIRYLRRFNRSLSQSEDLERNARREKVQRIVKVLVPYLRVFSLVYSITGIELTLYWNGVRGVYDVNSTGQLIPLTIGLCGLVQTLYIPTLEWLMKKFGNGWTRAEQIDLETAST
ncbi:hypothetical protein CEP52_002471 [Fusarium oligoseptatum]|uniref:Uncharacterized protein n=1 Tax=Fusarium oligoseptatum TaxID=2604345 RepID=A0A428UDP3_9HYPO|nr:hypothetical protein CEP52_002471 [Fusarium oligoseptatum]